MMVQMGACVTRSLPLAAFALTVAFFEVGAFAPPHAMHLASIEMLPSRSFLVLPCQQQQRSILGTETIKLTRCRPILFASSPGAPPPETSGSNESDDTSESNSSSAPAPQDNNNDSDRLVLRIVLGAVAAVTAYVIANMAIASATQLVASVQSNFWVFLGNLPEMIGALFAALFGFLKVFLPAVGKLGISAYETASPIVSETSQRAIEAATPVLQDTAEKVAGVAAPLLEEATKTANEAAAPYVQQLNSAVETSIVTPIQDARGVVEMQVQETTQAVSGAVEAQVQSTTKALGDAVDAQIQEATKVVESRIQSTTKTMGDALDTQLQKLKP